MKFNVVHEIPDEIVFCLLNTAIDGGQSEHFRRMKRVAPEEWTWCWNGEQRFDAEYPLNPGGALLFELFYSDREPFRLDRDALLCGAAIFAKHYPHHLADATHGNVTAVNGSVFLQCCLFGEVRF